MLKTWAEGTPVQRLTPGNWYIQKKTNGDYVIFQQHRANITLAPDDHTIRLTQPGVEEQEWDSAVSSCPINDPHCPACNPTCEEQ